MTLLVARQCRLLGAAGSLRRLPAAITTRSYAGDASPELPLKTRKQAATQRGGLPTTETKPLRAREDGPRFTVTGNALQSDSQLSASKRPRADDSVLVTPALQDCEIGSVHSAILVPAAVTATVGVVASLKRRSLTPADTRALRTEA